MIRQGLDRRVVLDVQIVPDADDPLESRQVKQSRPP